MSALAKAKQSWKELKQGKPGKRFQQRYEEKHGQGGGGGARRVITLIVGGIVFAAGLFFLPAPGPGFIIVALGAGILAQESLWMAKALDSAELKGRAVAGWALGVWRRAGIALKAAIVVLALALAGGLAYLAWRVMFGS